MATLMDALNGQLSSLAATPSGGGEETESLQGLMRAKTGKAISAGSTPRASSLQEQSAGAAAAGQAQQVQQAGAATGAKLGAQANEQEQQFQAQTAQVDIEREKVKSEYANRAASLLQEFEMGKAQLDGDKDKAKAEQLGFLTRLSSDKYVTQLQQAGAEKRLDDANKFEEALSEEVFGQEGDLLRDRLEMGDLLNIDDNQFKEEMGKMDLDFAISLASAKKDAANQQAMWTAVGGMAGAGVQAYGASKGGVMSPGYKDYKESAEGRGDKPMTYEKWSKMTDEQDTTQGPVRR